MTALHALAAALVFACAGGAAAAGACAMWPGVSMILAIAFTAAFVLILAGLTIALTAIKPANSHL